MTKRTILIGDIHGCFDEFRELLKKTNYNETQDRLILLGDLINKGPKSIEVIRFVLKKGFECVRGNHEQGFIEAVEGKRNLTGGFKKLANEIDKDRELSLDKVVEWMKSFPLYIEEDEFIAVHAGLAPDCELEDQLPRVLTRIRTWDGVGTDLDNDEDPAWFELYRHQKLIVFGHWARRGLVIRDNCIGLDSGCVWGGKLSALLLPKREILNVEAKEVYCDP